MLMTTLLMLAPLTVVVEDVRSDKGDIYISVQTSDEYMQSSSSAGSMEDPEKGTMTLEYEVPEGTYAISVWHDEDGNGEFDRQENGMPLDGWALSSDGSGWQFDDVSFKVSRRGKTVTVEMEYPE
ncbi:MAG: DUF2141 domain-containing protein [Pseudomonadota bacterium]